MAGRGIGRGIIDADVRLLESGYLADTTIVCEGREWNAHKVILSSRNKWFQKALTGPFREAATGKLELKEKDPDLVDLVLRFIYARDLNLPDPKDGKDSPAYYVDVFRIADFFLIDELKKAAINGIGAHIGNTPTFIDDKRGYGQNRKWVSGVLEALENASQDDSTADILKVIQNFVYPNMHRIFRSKNAINLLRKVPDLAVDLIENYVAVDLGTKQGASRTRLGLQILAAVDPSRGWYDTKSTDLGPETSDGKPLLLYVDLNASPAVFKVVDASTEREVKAMKWMAPPASQVKRISRNPDSEVVQVERKKSTGETSWVYLCFDNDGDAKTYVDRYCNANKAILVNPKINSNLGKKMRVVMESAVANENFRPLKTG